MPSQRLRIFVSSPGDVSTARELVLQVIEKLAADYIRFFTIEPYLWEYEPMLASGHFQDSIEAPRHFDAVILILESRLGTLLPTKTSARTYRGMDGRSPVTGTEWEFEDAVVGARENKGVPAILVYRSKRKAQFDSWDAQSRQQVIAQVEALEAFWSRHFSDEQHIIGAFSQYNDEKQLAARLERDLRATIERRISEITAAPLAAIAKIWAKSPYRGLERYEFEHAKIFLGRQGPTGEALLRLTTRAAELQPFLLMLGASGSGKSSLVRAGLVPRLFLPHRVPDTAFLRWIVFRPSERLDGEDIFSALARRLSQEVDELQGLPELTQSDPDTEALANHMRAAHVHPELPFTMVLDRLAEQAINRGRMLPNEKAKIILVVDQLEELFASDRVPLDERAMFAKFLAGCVRSQRIWVICTMRADFWHRVSELPDLLALADAGGRMDLVAPTVAEISQMIRGPAELAALDFEEHPETRVPLNEQIAADALSESGALPLLSFVLDQLYRQDVESTGGSKLRYATYQNLGGLKGAIATRADEVLDAQSTEVQGSLRQVLFSLVQAGSSSDPAAQAVSRRASLAEFPQDSDRRRLVDALLDVHARLLVADALPGGQVVVSLVHEALVNQWTKARDYVEANREALRIRRAIEERFGRWQVLKQSSGAAANPTNTGGTIARLIRWAFPPQAGLLSDVDLSDATRLLRDYQDELSLPLIRYIEQSIAADRRHTQRTLRIAATVAVVTALLAFSAFLSSLRAHVALAAVRRESTIAADTTNFMQSVFQNVDPESDNGRAGSSVTARALLDQGVRQIRVGETTDAEIRASVLTAMGEAYSGLGLWSEAEALQKEALDLEQSSNATPLNQVRTLLAYGTTLYRASDYQEARKYLQGAVDLANSKLERNDLERSSSLVALANLDTQEHQYAAAIELCGQALEVDSRRGPEGAVVFATSLDALGQAYHYSDHLPEAETQYRKALAILEHTDDTGAAERADVQVDLAATLYQEGKIADSIAVDQQALPTFRAIYTEDHTQTAAVLNNIARSQLMMGDLLQARALFLEALGIDQKIEAPTHDDFVFLYNSLGMIAAFQENFADAGMYFGKADYIARMPEHDEILDQVLLNEADLALHKGDKKGASELLKQSRGALQSAHPNDPPNAWRYALSDSVAAELSALDGIADASMAKIRASRATVAEHFGEGSFYVQLIDKRTKFIARSGHS